ncbi:MAG TPA: hypothetical protein VJ396_07300, partial [Acidiferrobacterales bacterium]|nr:hypothetical protein [Acidiferrobacterales bacterium]
FSARPVTKTTGDPRKSKNYYSTDDSCKSAPGKYPSAQKPFHPVHLPQLAHRLVHESNITASLHTCNSVMILQ